MGTASKQGWLTDLFGDDVSMLVHELLLSHMLPRKVFNLFVLEKTQYLVCTRLNTSDEIDSNFFSSDTLGIEFNSAAEQQLDYLRVKKTRRNGAWRIWERS